MSYRLQASGYSLCSNNKIGCGCPAQKPEARSLKL